MFRRRKFFTYFFCAWLGVSISISKYILFTLLYYCRCRLNTRLKKRSPKAAFSFYKLLFNSYKIYQLNHWTHHCYRKVSLLFKYQNSRDPGNNTSHSTPWKHWKSYSSREWRFCFFVKKKSIEIYTNFLKKQFLYLKIAFPYFCISYQIFAENNSTIHLIVLIWANPTFIPMLSWRKGQSHSFSQCFLVIFKIFAILPSKETHYYCTNCVFETSILIHQLLDRVTIFRSH